MRQLYSSIEDIAIQRTAFLPQLKQRVSCLKLYEITLRMDSPEFGRAVAEQFTTELAGIH